MNASQKSRADKRKKELLERKQRKQAQAESSSATVEQSSGSQSSGVLTVKDLIAPGEYRTHETASSALNSVIGDVIIKWDRWAGQMFEHLENVETRGLIETARQVARLDLRSSIERQNILDDDVQAAHRDLDTIGDWTADNAAHILSVLRKQRELRYPIQLTTREKEGLTRLAETYQSMYPGIELFSDTLVDIQAVDSPEPEDPSPYDRNMRPFRPMTNGMIPVWANRLEQIHLIHHWNKNTSLDLLLSYFPASMEFLHEISKSLYSISTSLSSKMLKERTPVDPHELEQTMMDSKKGMNLLNFLYSRGRDDPEMECLRLRTHIFNTLTGKRPTTEDQAQLMTPNLRAEFERRLA